MRIKLLKELDSLKLYNWYWIMNSSYTFYNKNSNNIDISKKEKQLPHYK